MNQEDVRVPLSAGICSLSAFACMWICSWLNLLHLEPKSAAYVCLICSQVFSLGGLSGDVTRFKPSDK